MAPCGLAKLSESETQFFTIKTATAKRSWHNPWGNIIVSKGGHGPRQRH